MAGEIQLNSTTMATESSGSITLSNVDSAINRTNLGLGSMATQDANAVALTGGSITGITLGSSVSGLSDLITSTNATTTTDTGEITGNTDTAFGNIASLDVVSGDKLLVLINGGFVIMQSSVSGNNLQPFTGLAYSFDNFATTPTYEYHGRFLATQTSTEDLQVLPTVISLLSIGTTGTIYIKPALRTDSALTTARWNGSRTYAAIQTTLIRLPA
jgi:hypothetical protein